MLSYAERALAAMSPQRKEYDVTHAARYAERMRRAMGAATVHPITGKPCLAIPLGDYPGTTAIAHENALRTMRQTPRPKPRLTDSDRLAVVPSATRDPGVSLTGRPRKLDDWGGGA